VFCVSFYSSYVVGAHFSGGSSLLTAIVFSVSTVNYFFTAGYEDLAPDFDF
jgi:hypothetical protein